jgi:hypothetical protein
VVVWGVVGASGLAAAGGGVLLVVLLLLLLLLLLLVVVIKVLLIIFDIGANRVTIETLLAERPSCHQSSCLSKGAREVNCLRVKFSTPLAKKKS